MKKLLLLIVIGIFAGCGIGIFVSHSHNHNEQSVKSLQTVKQAQIADPQPTVTPGIPLTISIPKIHVNATIESVGMDSQGRMDVPKTADDTAWYLPGYKPGMKGSAVIDGHLDRVTGAPAVFWNLKKLAPGDIINITENNGQTYTFLIDRIVRYPYNSFPIKEVFGASEIPMLNLITCNGVWDKNTKNYSDRLVVYSKLVSQK
jgi:sortase A